MLVKAENRNSTERSGSTSPAKKSHNKNMSSAFVMATPSPIGNFKENSFIQITEQMDNSK